MFSSTGSGNEGTIQAWSHRAIGWLKRLQRRNTILSHLWKKSPNLPQILAWHTLCLQKLSYAVMWCSCLSIYLFITAWMWPISAKFYRAAAVSKVSSSYRFPADKQQHICPSCWGRDSSSSLLLLDTGAHVQRRRGYQSPCCKKSGKGACLLFSIRVSGQETQSWGEASCRRGAFWNYLFDEKALVLSSHLSLRAGSSRGRQAPAHGQSKVPRSQRREGFGILHFRNSVFYFCFRGR